MHLIRIDSSSRRAGSHSRALADHFETAWRTADPAAEIRRRDLAQEPIPHITDETITAFYTPTEQLDPDQLRATARSDELIAELRSADGLLLSVPMYNFGVPSGLKAWIDQVVRVGHTFEADSDGLRGLLTTRFAVVATASGAAFTDTPYEPMDFLRPYLRGLFGFLGIARVEFLSLEGTTLDPAAVERALPALHARADVLAAELVRDTRTEEAR